MTTTKKCRAIVPDRFNWAGRQCSRNAVVTRDGRGYCKQHDPEAVEAKRSAHSAERNDRYTAQVRARAIAARNKRGVEALRAWAAETDTLNVLGPKLGAIIEDVIATDTEADMTYACAVKRHPYCPGYYIGFIVGQPAQIRCECEHHKPTKERT